MMTLINQLHSLESSGLVRLAQSQPELEYLFRHALIQDAAYGSLVKYDRKRLHLAVGEALELIYPDRLDELAPRLAEHFDEAGDTDRALDYFSQAGDAAFRMYANIEAVAHYSRALELALRATHVGGDALTYLYARLGRALELNSQFDQALASYEDMERLAQARDDRPMALAALVLQAQIRCTVNSQFNPEQGEALSRQALTLAQELGDRAAESRILRNLISLYRFTNRLPQARDCGERSLLLARELVAAESAEWMLREQIAYTLNDLAHAHGMTGGLSRTQELLREAIDLWRELGNLPMLTDSLSTACLYTAFSGDFETAIALSDEAFHISRSIGNLWGQSYSQSIVGLVYWERGEPDRAIDVMDECVRLGEQAGYVVAGTWTLADLGLIYGYLGAVERGIELARRAAALAETSLPIFRPYALGTLAQLHLMAHNRVDAQVTVEAGDLTGDSINLLAVRPIRLAHCLIALAQGDFSRATSIAADLVTSLRGLGTRPYVPYPLYLQGRALAAMGDDEAAYACLQEARAEAEALGLRWSLWPILVALSDGEARRGNATEAQTLHRQAREIVEFIAEHTPQEFRASFLDSPMVRQAVGADAARA